MNKVKRVEAITPAVQAGIDLIAQDLERMRVKPDMDKSDAHRLVRYLQILAVFYQITNENNRIAVAEYRKLNGINDND